MYKGFTDKAWDDLTYWINTDKKVYKRIKRLLDDIERNIGSETFSGYHLIGTNRMSDDKNSGVVDGSFKVFGINNLYVCDASIFPDFVSTHQYLHW